MTTARIEGLPGHLNENRRHNLPAYLPQLIGREHELNVWSPLLRGDEAHLLTLVGTGGCGKTRLALEFARAAVDDFPDGVWLVELAPLADAALVEQTVASVLGVREKPDLQLMTTLIESLRNKHLLLVLDNCEHLIDACAEFADLILRDCPDVSILATNREPLHISSEQVRRVSPLAAPEPHQVLSPAQLGQVASVRLFVLRAQSASGEFELTPSRAAPVAEVCARRDGIPLALELAAARTNVLSVDQIAARRSDSFRLLKGGSRTAPTRQQTLEATQDWSYELLTPAEQTLFRRLAVCAGGFDLEAAEALGSSEAIAAEAVLDLLEHLVDRSLVVVDDRDSERRYRLLEPVRRTPAPTWRRVARPARSGRDTRRTTLRSPNGSTRSR